MMHIVMNSQTIGAGGPGAPAGRRVAPSARALRRIGIAIVLSLLAHALVVGSAMLGLIDLFPWLTHTEPPPPVVQARIVPLPPAPPPAPVEAVAEAPSPAPVVKPAPRRPAPVRKPRPAPAAPPVLTSPTAPAPVATGETPDAIATDAPPAAEAPSAPEPAASSEPGSTAAAPPSKPARTAPLPARARIQFEITLESNNFKMVANQDWEMRDGRYRVRLAGNLRILFAVRTLTMASEGAVTAAGLRPELHVDERNNKRTVINFSTNEQSAQVSEANGNQKTVALSGQAADLMSLPYDLAFNPDVPIGTVFTLAIRDNFEELRLVEKRDEVLSTDTANINTRFYDFQRVNGGGGAQVWLSLDRQWLPVKLRVVGRDGPISLLATRYDLNPPD